MKRIGCTIVNRDVAYQSPMARTIKISLAAMTVIAFQAIAETVPGEFAQGGAGSNVSSQKQAEENKSIGKSGVLSYVLPIGQGLRIAYNSASGWDVGSVASVTRSGKFGNPAYDDNDIFMLNGQELVCASNCNSGATRVYHTQQENYQRIEYINPGQNDSFWKVTAQDGTVTLYGHINSSANSRVETIRPGAGAAAPRAWLIAKVRNPASDTKQRYHYTQQDGQYYLQTVVSGKKTAATNGHLCTRLSYGTLPSENRRISFAGGSKVITRYFVTDATEVVGCDNSGNGGKQLKRHHIIWENSPLLSQRRVKSVQTFGTDDTTALKPIAFSYYDSPTGFSTNELNWGNPEGPGHTDAVQEYSGDGNTYAELMDMDGDGLPDRVRKRDDENFKIWINQGNGFAGGVQTWTEPGSYNDYLRDGANTKTDLMDMNGDGLVDRIRKKGGECFSIGLNNGNGFDAPIPWSNANPEGSGCSNGNSWPIRVSVSSSGGTPQGTIIDVMDMNGDGLPDRVLKNTTSGQYPKNNNNFIVWLNTGSGFGASTASWGNPEGELGLARNINHSESETQVSMGMRDMNGDGLVDRIRKAPGEPLRIWFNNGQSFEPQSVSWNMPGNYLRVTQKQQGGIKHTMWDFVDINGDGLPDRVKKQRNEDTNHMHVWMNTGNGFAANSVEWSGMVNDYLYSVGSNENQSVLMDVNGDKLPDRVVKCEDNCAATDFLVRFNQGLPNEIMIHAIMNQSTGSRRQYTYQPQDISPNGASAGYSLKKWVVKSETTFDGVGNVGRPDSDRTTTYDYYGGTYNRVYKEDYGFAAMLATAPTGDVSEQHFYQSFDRRGLPRKTLTRQGAYNGAIHNMSSFIYANLSDNSNDYSHGISQARNTFGPDLVVQAQRKKRANSYIVSGTTSTDLGMGPKEEGDGFIRTKVDYLYNTEGNVWKEINYGVVSPTGEDQGIDKVVTTTTWAKNLPKWIMKPREKSVTAWKKSGYELASKERYFYDNKAYGVMGNKGQLTKKHTYKTANSHADTTYVYGGWGNLQSTTDARGNTTKFYYDSTFHSYPIKTEYPSELNITVAQTTSYDNRMRVKKKTDANGVDTLIYDYDALSRIRGEVRPGDTLVVPTLRHHYTEYAGKSSPASVITLKREISGDPDAIHESVVYRDGFGKIIQTKTEAQVNGNQVWTTQDNWRYINGNKSIDFSSFKYQTGNSDFTRPATPQKRASRTASYLDTGNNGNLGTVTETINMAGDAAFSRRYLDKVDHLDAALHQTRTISDLKGLSTRHQEYTGTFPNTTFYHEVENSERMRWKQVQEAAWKTSEFFYNMVGNQVKMDDMDRGVWTWVYNNNGDMSKQTDANGNTITFAYDVQNRLKTKTYPDGSTIEYFYDGDNNRDGNIDNTWQGMIGRLTKVIDSSGFTLMRYDERGRLVWEKKAIMGSTHRVTQYIYDAMDRIIGIKYPGSNSFSTITYDGGARPDTFVDADGNTVVQQTHYNVRGDLQRVIFPSSRIDYAYWGTGRNQALRSIESINTAANQPLVKFEYDYDVLGNITTIDGYYQGNPNDKFSRTFEYDDFSRLTAQANPAYYGGAETLEYWKNGNIKKHNGNNYVYNPSVAPEHGVVEMGGKTFAYDANGNMTRYNGMAIEYNYDGKPSRVHDEEYVYDYSGRRVFKNVGGVETRYFNRYFEVRNNTGLQNVYHLDRLVAQRPLNGAYTWYHGDHLGGTSQITDTNGNKVKQLFYSAYGVTVRNNGSGSSPEYQYTGKELDATGLLNYGARLYSPVLGRFIQADTVYDPAAGIQGSNRYSYAANNPIRFIDPTGHSGINAIKQFLNVIKLVQNTQSLNSSNLVSAGKGAAGVTEQVAKTTSLAAKGGSNMLSSTATALNHYVDYAFGAEGATIANKLDDASKAAGKFSDNVAKIGKDAEVVGKVLTRVEIGTDIYHAATADNDAAKHYYTNRAILNTGMMAISESGNPLVEALAITIEVSDVVGQGLVALGGEHTDGIVEVAAQFGYIAESGHMTDVYDGLENSNSSAIPGVDELRNALGSELNYLYDHSGDIGNGIVTGLKWFGLGNDKP